MSLSTLLQGDERPIPFSTPSPVKLEEPDFSFHRCDQLCWIVANALLEHDLNVAHIADPDRWIAGDHYEIRILPNCDRSRAICSAEECRSVQRADADRLQRCETTFYEQLERALVRIARDDTADSRRIRTDEQSAAGTHERQLHRLSFREKSSPHGRRAGVDRCFALLEGGAKLRIEKFQSRRQWPARHERLEHGWCGCECDFVAHQIRDQRAHCITVWIHVRYCFLTNALARAFVWLLVGNEIGRHIKSVLEVIDAECRCFAKSHRAQMRGELHPALVRFLDRRA